MAGFAGRAGLAVRLFTENFNENAILDTPLDLRNQRVVKADADRTRLAEIRAISSMSNQEIAEKIEKLLTFYTKKSGTTYKQGYNEIVGPFIWLAY